MKKPFRFYRGEFNGAYVLAFLLCKNDAVKDIMDELVYQACFQWKLEDEITSGELPVRDEDIIGLGKFAGIFRPIQYISSNIGSIRLTTSTLVNGVERSERRLFNMTSQVFETVHGDADDYPTDIVNEATSNKRQTLVPTGQVPVGHVAYGTDLFYEDGTIIEANLLSTRPTDGTPYTPYYGDKFLFFEETFKNVSTNMTIDMYKKYFESLMRIRHNGASIKEFLYITDLLCEDYVTNIEITQTAYYYTVLYDLNGDSTIDNKTGRMATWESVCAQKFKLFTLVER
jgi:hypothetical protein